jgi:hypothetical protein
LESVPTKSPFLDFTSSWATKINIAMAQSLSFFGNRRGSTKSHTYQVNGGQQITKDRVDEVKNPRTNGQMVHRCCLHTLSDAHAYLRPFIGRFWEGAQSPAASLAAFRKANYPILRAAAEDDSVNFTFSPYQQNIRPWGLFKVSKGILAEPNFSYSGSNTQANYTQWNVAFASPKGERILDEFAAHGLKVGDRYTYVIMRVSPADGSPVMRFVTLQFICPVNKLMTEAAVTDYIKVVAHSQDVSVRITNTSQYFFRIWLDEPIIVYDNRAFLWARVLQRRINGKEHFSTAYFRTNRGLALPNDFAQIIATYPQGGGNVLDGGAI